jgi:hypothetical protein
MSVFLAIVFIAAFGYYLSLRIHPDIRCKRCDSSSRHYDLVYAGRRHLCPECRGTGRRKRLGARLFLGRAPRLRLQCSWAAVLMGCSAHGRSAHAVVMGAAGRP